MTINYQQADLVGGNLSYQWNLANGEDGAPTNHSGTADRTVQVFGTFGVGGTVLIEGSLDNQHWDTLRDTQGVALSFTASGLRAVLENAVWIRPRVSGGDGTTAVTVIVNVRR